MRDRSVKLRMHRIQPQKLHQNLMRKNWNTTEKTNWFWPLFVVFNIVVGRRHTAVYISWRELIACQLSSHSQASNARSLISVSTRGEAATWRPTIIYYNQLPGAAQYQLIHSPVLLHCRCVESESSSSSSNDWHLHLVTNDFKVAKLVSCITAQLTAERVQPEPVC